ncbi:hypothetical protein [Lysobacter sp. N42]|uniref:hypothetical protein n=1 Tax=Lysobacter sp. N42 TaxID=2545719 RepID=UPI00104676CE|nr:hypothetical protein [Lysobacter sp. N42]TCZ83340.1 hypothetical protein EYQ95_21695 [Lysobacter sp. N42]
MLDAPAHALAAALARDDLDGALALGLFGLFAGSELGVRHRHLLARQQPVEVVLGRLRGLALGAPGSGLRGVGFGIDHGLLVHRLRLCIGIGRGAEEAAIAGLEQLRRGQHDQQRQGDADDQPGPARQPATVAAGAARLGFSALCCHLHHLGGGHAQQAQSIRQHLTRR